MSPRHFTPRRWRALAAAAALAAGAVAAGTGAGAASLAPRSSTTGTSFILVTPASPKGISVSGYSFSAVGAGGTAGASTGGVKAGEVIISKKTDASSAPLFAAMSDGAKWPTVRLAVLLATRKAGSPPSILEFTFSDVVVSSISYAGTSDEYPKESVTLSYTAVAVAVTSHA